MSIVLYRWTTIAGMDQLTNNYVYTNCTLTIYLSIDSYRKYTNLKLAHTCIYIQGIYISTEYVTHSNKAILCQQRTLLFRRFKRYRLRRVRLSFGSRAKLADPLGHAISSKTCVRIMIPTLFNCDDYAVNGLTEKKRMIVGHHFYAHLQSKPAGCFKQPASFKLNINKERTDQLIKKWLVSIDEHAVTWINL